MPILQNRTRHLRQQESQASSARQAAARHGQNSRESAELPVYQSLCQPLSPASCQLIADITSGNAHARESRKYAAHQTDSLEMLSEAVSAVFDALQNQRTRLDNLRDRRLKSADAAKMDQSSPQEVKQANYVTEMQARVAELSIRSEVAVRSVLDWKAELEDEAEIARAVQERMHAEEVEWKAALKRNTERRAGRDGDNNDEEGDARNPDENVDEDKDLIKLHGPSELFEEELKAKQEKWQSMSTFARYAENNDYITFKRGWHEAVHANDGKPLPDASKWFDKDGMPVLDMVEAEAKDDAEDDDEIVVQREVRDFKCPLTMQIIKEPYTSRLCKHSFEKTAILAYIKGQHHGSGPTCPNVGCAAIIRNKDLFYDKNVLRQIQRAQRAEEEQDEDESDEHENVDVEGDASLLVGRSIRVKMEKAGRQPVEELVDDEGDVEMED